MPDKGLTDGAECLTDQSESCSDSSEHLSYSSEHLSDSSDEWTEENFTRLDAILDKTQTEASVTPEKQGLTENLENQDEESDTSDDFFCQKALCQRCLRNDPNSKKQATLVRYCPYCNQRIGVCSMHSRCYTPHSKNICAIPGVPYKSGRVIKKPNELLQELITIAAADGFYFQAPLKTECIRNDPKLLYQNCESCLKLDFERKSEVKRFCPLCAKPVHVCLKHERATTPHENCDNEFGAKNKYLRRRCPVPL